MNVLWTLYLCGSVLALALNIIYMCFYHKSGYNDFLKRLLEKIFSSILVFLLSWFGVFLICMSIYAVVEKNSKK